MHDSQAPIGRVEDVREVHEPGVVCVDGDAAVADGGEFSLHDDAGLGPGAVVVPAVGADVALGAQRGRVEDGAQLRVGDVADLPDFTLEVGADAVEDVAVGRAGAGAGSGRVGVAGRLVFAVRGVRLRAGGGVGIAGEQLEHEGLIDAVLRVGARVEAEGDDGVAPGSGAEHVADVLEGLFEGLGVFLVDDVVGDGAAGPDGAGGEEGLELGNGALEGWVEGFEGGEVGGWSGRDACDVVGDELRGYLGGGLSIACCEVAS